jgi:hypothetical protein
MLTKSVLKYSETFQVCLTLIDHFAQGVPRLLLLFSSLCRCVVFNLRALALFVLNLKSIGHTMKDNHSEIS